MEKYTTQLSTRLEVGCLHRALQDLSAAFVNASASATEMKREAEDELGGEDKKLPPIESSLPGVDTANEGPEDDDIASMLGLKQGARLEVKWDIVNDETDTTVTRWWGCVLGTAVGKHTLADEEENDEGEDENPEVCTLYEITYDLFLPEFPETSVSQVCFLSDHMLYAVAEDATFAWRQNGDSWDEEEESEDEEGAETKSPKNQVSAESENGSATARGGGATDNDGGMEVPDPAAFVDGLLTSILNKHNAKMASLPYLQQGFVASVVAQSKEKLTASIEALLAAKRDAGKPPVVSKEDMDDLLVSVGSELESIKTAAAQELSS